MGGLFSRVFGDLIGKKDCKIVMVGLDAAGKTTVLYKLKLGDMVTTIPTIGFNVETVEYKNLKFTMWDVGGQDKLRPLWRHYYENTNAVIYVVDSNDTGRMEASSKELGKLLEAPELNDATLLVLANKQDLPNAVSPAEVADRLKLTELPTTRKWYIQGCCATQGEGLFEGLDWLATQLK